MLRAQLDLQKGHAEVLLLIAALQGFRRDAVAAAGAENLQDPAAGQNPAGWFPAGQHLAVAGCQALAGGEAWLQLCWVGASLSQLK